MVNPQAMSFKLNLGLQQAFALPTHHIICIQGRDASVFLQAQFMNDVSTLSNGQWQYTGILNPQGRVLALFQLAKIDNEHFFILLASLKPQWLIEHLKRFIFRSKVSINLEEQYFVQGLFTDNHSSISSVQTMHGDANNGYTLDIPDLNCTRKLLVMTTSAEHNLLATDNWHHLDMASGWLWIDEKLQNLWTPQMLSLQELNAYSLKKGCYPGQEIVARTHYLGKSKRNLRTISGQGFIAGQPLYQNANEIGKIANCNQGGDYAKAVLPVEINLDIPITNQLSTIIFI
jgi:folate-binding protein YgfZ